jgi:hypothetical protein
MSKKASGITREIPLAHLARVAPLAYGKSWRRTNAADSYATLARAVQKRRDAA